MPRFSQGVGEIGIQDSDISINITPENPEPYQDIKIRLTSYATDLNKALIEWQSGSNIVLSGIGRTNYSFKALGPNTVTTLSVIITPSGSLDKITRQIVINPSEIDILWESVDGYTPAFYRGKSFASAESLIKAVAISNTSTQRSGKGNIVYTWKNNGNTVAGSSGYNKDSYIFANSELNKNEEVSVAASSVDESYSAAKTIKIPIVRPEIVFYEKSPTEGILYNNSLKNNTVVIGDEMTIVAVPYFLAVKGNEGKFSYKWKINDEDIATPSKKTELTIRPASRGGYATIGLSLENLSTFFQKVSGQLKLTL